MGRGILNKSIAFRKILSIRSEISIVNTAQVSKSHMTQTPGQGFTPISFPQDPSLDILASIVAFLVMVALILFLAYFFVRYSDICAVPRLRLYNTNENDPDTADP